VVTQDDLHCDQHLVHPDWGLQHIITLMRLWPGDQSEVSLGMKPPAKLRPCDALLLALADRDQLTAWLL
jgi:hypothetical protein